MRKVCLMPSRVSNLWTFRKAKYMKINIPYLKSYFKIVSFQIINLVN